jgi:hypothetical protein
MPTRQGFSLNTSQVMVVKKEMPRSSARNRFGTATRHLCSYSGLAVGVQDKEVCGLLAFRRLSAHRTTG